MSRGPAVWSKSALQRLAVHVTMGRDEQSQPFSSVLWLRMMQAVLTVHSAALGLRICRTHTLCLKNVLDRASRHKPHYVSVKCEGWLCARIVLCACVCVWVRAGVENILYE